MDKVLVIEDTPAALEGILSLLRWEGFEAIGADNGVAGVELARRHAPDLIVCDIVMPGADGYSVLATLRQDPATAMIPVIFLTAKASREELREGMGLGADDYVTKPFAAEELIFAVRARLERRAAGLRETQGKLAELQERILRNMPHELLTPLAGIVGAADLLVEDAAAAGNEPIIEMARLIATSGERLERLVQNLLLHMQIEVLEADPTQVRRLRESCTADAGAVVADVARQTAHAAARDEDIVVEVVGDVCVRIAEDHLRKIVRELVQNACKFSAERQPVRVQVDGGETCQVRISDRGRGMTGEQFAAIEAFQQFERKRYEQQGSGSGLYIAKRLAELYGGRLTIESVPGEGTTVCVTLRGAPDGAVRDQAGDAGQLRADSSAFPAT